MGKAANAPATKPAGTRPAECRYAGYADYAASRIGKNRSPAAAYPCAAARRQYRFGCAGLLTK